MLKAFGKFLNRFGTAGAKFIREDDRVFVVLMILNLPIFIQAFFHRLMIIPFEEGFSDGLPGFWRGTFFILLLCIAMNILFSRLPRVKSFLQADMIQIVMGTNPLTAKEFLIDYVLTFPIIGGTIFLIAAIVTASKVLKKFFVTRSEERLRRFSFDLLIIFLPLILL